MPRMSEETRKSRARASRTTARIVGASYVSTPAHLAVTIRRRLRSFLKSIVPPIAVGRPVLRVVWSRPRERPAPAAAAAPPTLTKDSIVRSRKMR